MTTGRWLAACLAVLTQACASQPQLPPEAIIQNDQGVDALATGNLENARARFELALEYNSRFIEALANLGLVELQLGNLARARQLLTRAQRINAHVAQPHHGLGVLAEREGKTNEASRHYRAALAVDPGFQPSRLNLARLLFSASRLYEAKLQYEKLLQLQPNTALSHAGLAETLLRLKRTDEAERIVDDGLAQFGDSQELQLLKARSELRHGQVDFAVARLVPLTAERNHIAVEAFGWIAVAELARQRPRHAAGAAKRALKLDNSAPVARHALGIALERLGDARAPEFKSPSP
jgi:tetratricopeptide (TPR) repeat protein